MCDQINIPQNEQKAHRINVKDDLTDRNEILTTKQSITREILIYNNSNTYSQTPKHDLETPKHKQNIVEKRQKIEKN